MRKVSIDQIEPGVLNGKAIYSFNNKLKLLNKGIPITTDYMKRLKDLGIYFIYVEDELSEGIELQNMISDELQVHAQQCVVHVMQNIRNGQTLKDSRVVNKSVNKIMDELFNQRDLEVNITDIRAADDYTFGHSVSVCTLSIILGMLMGLNDLELRDLGVGAILHDVGKTKIPMSILNKPGKLTDEEMAVIQTHPQAGFDILRKCDTLNRNSVNVALSHHERYDGTGYPNGFKYEDIHLFSRIVSVVDVFDAMTADRVYRQGMETRRVVKYLQLMSNKHFDAKIVDTFIDNVILYPNGSYVVLNTKEKAIVVQSSPQNREQPLVRICTDPEGQPYRVYREVDLKDNPEYWIESTCSGI